MNLDFYIDTVRRELVGGPTNSTIVAVPVLAQGNTFTLRIRALTPTPDFPVSDPPYELVAVAGRTIQFAIGTKAGNASTHYVEQYTWTADTSDLSDPFWYADIAMNTAGITTLLGTSASATSWMEINLVEGAPRTILSKQVTIEASVIKNATLTVPAGLTPLSAEAAAALYLAKSGVTGKTVFTSPDGTKSAEVYYGDDGSWHVDPLT